MAWDDEPPKKSELLNLGDRWDATPPSESELSGSGDFSLEGLARGTLKALPVAGAMFGGAAGGIMGIPSGPGAIATGVAGAGLGMAAGESLKNIGEHFLGDEKTREEIYAGPAKAALEGATFEMGGQLIGPAMSKASEYAGPAINKIRNAVGGKAGQLAENFAENATGATAVQASKFKEGSGRELLDRKLVRFGDNQEKIASRVSGAMDEANAAIDSSLKQLDAKGVTASADNVVAELQAKVAALRKDPSQAGTVRKIESIINDIIETGSSNVPLSQGETTKRGFRKAAGNWMDPDAGQAGKQAYLSYMDEVEGAAKAADPALAKSFEEGKKTFGLLAPIEEAASRRALQQNQSPIGGLLDVAAAGSAGATVGGPLGLLTGAGAAVGRRVISPRISSTAAVSLDKISKALMSSPEMAKVARQNPSAFKSMVQMLGNRANGDANSAFPRAADTEKQPEPMNFQESSGKDALLKKTNGTKYAQVLQNAAKNGDHSFSAANFVLSQRDPDYRKLTEGE